MPDSPVQWSKRLNICARIRRLRPRTAHARRLASIFGLEGGLVETLYDDFELTPASGKIIAVVGPSGAGKSVLLNQVCRQVSGAMRLDVDGLARSGPPAISALGPNGSADLSERMDVLSRCGLAEPAALITPARRLSAGQLHRLALAGALWRAREIARPVIIADEFGATLDRPTGRVLGRQIRRIIRDSNLCVLVATHREDLLDDLQPDEIIVKALGEPARRMHPPRSRARRHHWRLRRGSLHDYRELAPFHYLTGPPAAHKRVYVIPAPRGDRRCGGPRLAGVAVVSPPLMSVRARTIVFGGRYAAPPPRVRLRRLNQEIESISRVIVHPVYRGEGLSVRLVRHILRHRATPVVEALAIMGRYHPFFQRAGMTGHYDDDLPYAYYHAAPGGYPG